MGRSRAVEIHYSKHLQAELVSIGEVMNTGGCTPSDECAIACQALQKFTRSSIPSTAVDLVQRDMDRVSHCSGPIQKSFGRVGCGAGLRP